VNPEVNVGSACARCGRTNPEGVNQIPLEWEAMVDAEGEVMGLVCDGCITPDDVLDSEPEVIVVAPEYEPLWREARQRSEARARARLDKSGTN
jgi:hypothetical protein